MKPWCGTSGEKEREALLSCCDSPRLQSSILIIVSLPHHRFSHFSVFSSRALAYNTRNAAVYAAIGFTQHLSRDIEGAIESYHKALSLQPGDAVTSMLLDQAMGDLFVAVE